MAYSPVFVFVEGFQYSLQNETAKIFDIYFNKILHKKVKIIDFVNFKKNKDWPRDVNIIYKVVGYIYEWLNILEHLPEGFDMYVFVNTPFSLMYYLHHVPLTNEDEKKQIDELRELCKTACTLLPCPNIVINHAGYPKDKEVFPMWRISRYNYFNSYKKVKPFIREMFLPAIALEKHLKKRTIEEDKLKVPKWLETYFTYKDPVLYMIGLDFINFADIAEDSDVTGAHHYKFLDFSDDEEMLLTNNMKDTLITKDQMHEFFHKHFNPVMYEFLQKDNQKRLNWIKRNDKKKESEKKKRRIKRRKNAKALLEKLEKEIEEEKEKEKEKPKKRKTRKKIN